jgi:hypothetical protein
MKRSSPWFHGHSLSITGLLLIGRKAGRNLS